MNTPPEDFVLVSEDRLLTFATTCFERVGMETEQAAALSRLLVNSDLRGVRSHGTRTVNGYCQAMAEDKLNPRPHIRQVHETPTAVVYDGDGGLGYVPMLRATAGAIAKAKEVGLGMGLVRYCGHYGSAGHYARLCMEQGCIGFSVQGYRDQGRYGNDGGGPNPDAHLGYFGNPPLCFAIPGGDGPPVVLDAATCILADDQRGAEYEALFSKIPAAFFKSIGYGAVASLMGGGLTGFTLSDEIRTRWPAARLGGMVLAIHIDSVVPEAIFRAETDRMTRDIGETYTPMPGTSRALLPGAIEEERMALHRQEGVRYGPMERQAAQSVCARLGVALPWA
ncbi:MAG: Ldh family oxidoreductase [Caldilineaceae bacterium]|nr:Ldh family oxidoreductase [Caldilineaceae bacterium]HRJ45183.1 Ldh family oxidoreductase [Caldilineaceae bacterium]